MFCFTQLFVYNVQAEKKPKWKYLGNIVSEWPKPKLQAIPIHHRGVNGAKIINPGSISVNEINLINYSWGDARVHHQICQSKFQHIHFFASPLSLDIWLRPTKILPGIGEFLFHSQGPVIAAR